MELIEMGARWYDPQLGRWLSPDSIIPDPSNPQSFNRYSYVYNNPVKYNDPSGHCPPCGSDSSGERWLALGWEWLVEKPPTNRVYGADSPLTKDVMGTTGVRITRTQIEQGYLQPDEKGVYTYRWSFNTPEKFWNATVDAVLNDNMAEHFLGGYTVKVIPNGDGTVTFRVSNHTSWESGTRNPVNLMGSEHSWEGLLLGMLPGEQYREENFVFPEDLLPESIFIDRPRTEVYFGGRMNQVYEWTEELQTEQLTYKKYPTELP